VASKLYTVVLPHRRKDLIQPHPLILIECVWGVCTSDVFFILDFEHLILCNTYSIQNPLGILDKSWLQTV
jgi:hypothetical protein